MSISTEEKSMSGDYSSSAIAHSISKELELKRSDKFEDHKKQNTHRLVQSIFVYGELHYDDSGVLKGDRYGLADDKCEYEKAKVYGYTLYESFCSTTPFVRETGDPDDALVGGLLKWGDKETVDWKLRCCERKENNDPFASAGTFTRAIVKAETLSDHRIVDTYLYHHSEIGLSPGYSSPVKEFWGRFRQIADFLKSPWCKNVVVAFGPAISAS